MKKSIIALTLVSCLSSTSALAKDKKQTQNELIGFGSGALVGAIVAGPVGAAVVGIFGIMIADDVNDADKLAAAQQQNAEKQQALLALQQELEQQQRHTEQQLAKTTQQLDYLQQQLKKNPLEDQRQIQFRSGSATLEEHYKPQLDALAKKLLLNRQLQVDLAGFADRRGEEQANQLLSQKRVNKVKQYLLDQGVKQDQIVASFHGANHPITQQQHWEGDFFDRRVQIQLSENQAQMASTK